MTKGKQVSLTCVQCFQVFTSTLKFMKHIKSHEEDEVQCHLPTCHRAFRRADLSLHLATNHDRDRELGLEVDHAQETAANSQSVRTVESGHRRPSDQHVPGEQYVGYTAAQPYQARHHS